jgi:hypothetical protein
VGTRTREEVNAACPRHEEVQSRTDLAVTTIQQLGGYRDAATYGTLVHKNLELQIKNLRDPDFVAERSFLKSGGLASYSQLGTVRIDVLENLRNGTVCVYDIKTGRSPLTAARSLEIARNVRANYTEAQRILVIETRPSVGP